MFIIPSVIVTKLGQTFVLLRFFLSLLFSHSKKGEGGGNGPASDHYSASISVM